MFGFGNLDLQRVAVAAVGAVVLATTFVSAAVAPASVPLEECLTMQVGTSQFSDLANA